MKQILVLIQHFLFSRSKNELFMFRATGQWERDTVSLWYHQEGIVVCQNMRSRNLGKNTVMRETMPATDAEWLEPTLIGKYDCTLQMKNNHIWSSFESGPQSSFLVT
jgi:hypothetical protein